MVRFSRAERRFQIERLKAKRKHYWGYGKPKHQVELIGSTQDGKRTWVYNLVSQRGLNEMSAQQLSAAIQHPQMCSCLLGCANARKAYGRTLAELRFERQAVEQLEEIE